MRRLLSSACLGLTLAAGGCADPSVVVSARQPIAFSHQMHLSYFSSGRHRAERIRMHTDLFGGGEAPQELAEGRCVACHDDLPERAKCAGCHVVFQDTALRSRNEIRPCIGCHRGAWGGSEATIPSATLCVACHEEGMRLARGDANGPRIVLARAGSSQPRPDETVTDVPWIRVTTVPGNVYFSHRAHVQFASLLCVRCHEDVAGATSTPAVLAISMSECLKCHAENGASTDCLTCHK